MPVIYRAGDTMRFEGQVYTVVETGLIKLRHQSGREIVVSLAGPSQTCSGEAVYQAKMQPRDYNKCG